MRYTDQIWVNRRTLVVMAVITSAILCAQIIFVLYNAPVRSDSIFVTTALPICKSKCLWSTGKNGSWIQDWNFSKHHAQYPQPLAVHPGPYRRKTDSRFQPSSDAPFPWPSSFRWVDHDDDCQVSIVDIKGFCNMLVKHNVHRILFFGDSLTASMYQSLMNYLGGSFLKLFEQNKTSSFVCNVTHAESLVENENDNKVQIGDNGGYPHTLTIHMKFALNKGGNPFPQSPRSEFVFDNSTREFIASSTTDRLLGIFNGGAHYHNRSHYYEDLDKMLNILADLGRPHDLYIFRSTSPGHKGCGPRSRKFAWENGTRDVPFTSYDDYLKTFNGRKHRFDWDEFEHYNHYAKDLFYERNRLGKPPMMHFLDIFNMTALRHDGHAAPADCLHYRTPGPIDWWNHMLFNYLKELSNDDGYSLHGNCLPLGEK